MFGGHLRHPGTRTSRHGRFVSRVSYQGRFVSAAAAVCGIAMLTAGCGLIGSSTASSSNSSNSSNSSSSSRSSSSGRSAYLDCLRQHGANIPTARPTPGSGGFGGGGFGGSGFGGGNSTFAQARQACASLRPSGGFGGGAFASAIQAFRSCMSSHGVTIPTTRPTAPPTSAPSGADRFLNGLNPGNPQVAAALSACQSKLPSFPSGG